MPARTCREFPARVTLYRAFVAQLNLYHDIPAASGLLRLNDLSVELERVAEKSGSPVLDPTIVIPGEECPDTGEPPDELAALLRSQDEESGRERVGGERGRCGDRHAQ